MTSVQDIYTGSLNLITHPEEVEKIATLVERFHCLLRSLNPIIEMECMTDYEEILNVYDAALVIGAPVIKNEIPIATTTEEFVDITAKLEDSVKRLEAVERVLCACFVNNFIRFY